MRLWIAALVLLDVSSETHARRSYLKRGHTLVAYYSGVVELDRNGREVWRYRETGVRGAQRLKNGNTLIPVGVQNKVIEVNPQGETVWEISVDTMHLHHAVRADNGLTWVASASNDARSGILSFAPDKTKRSHIQGQWPLTLQILRTGNIVVNMSSPRKATEIDTKGQVIWEWKGDQEPYGIERMQNGNTLVGQTAALVEVNPQGKIVWQIPTPAGSYLYAIKRLRNGNTLVGGLQGNLVEVDSKGKILWTYSDPEFGKGAYPGPHHVDRGE